MRRPRSCADLPLLDAIALCFSGSIEANPRLDFVVTAFYSVAGRADSGKRMQGSCGELEVSRAQSSFDQLLHELVDVRVAPKRPSLVADCRNGVLVG